MTDFVVLEESLKDHCVQTGSLMDIPSLGSEFLGLMLFCITLKLENFEKGLGYRSFCSICFVKEMKKINTVICLTVL